MLDAPQPFPGLDDPRRRLDHGLGSRRALEVNSEKVPWKDGGILPTPALSQRPSWLSSMVSLARHSLSPSSRSRHRHTSVHWKLSEGGLSLPFPSWPTVRFIFLCSLWYMSSAMSSNTGKVIFMQFRFPITLTIIQFGFVAAYSALLCNPVYGMTIFRPPTKAILRNTLPMAAFQVGGHMFSSFAISRIPVSTVHTIKALSPMFTVMAYACFFRVKYSVATYASLLPLTGGVMLACSFDTSAADIIGLISAFGSAIVFVSSNIFFKKVMPSTPSGIGPTTVPSHKLDKINMLLYSSSLAFLLMIPIWVSYDLGPLAALYYSSLVDGSTSKGPGPSVPLYFFLNGTVHFAQNLIAFAILASTSPVTYSIASLIKRIAVICIAVVWFNQHVHPLQGAGICLTFLGLWMYNSAKADVERGENKRRRIEAQGHLMLPISTRDSELASSLPLRTIDEKVEWATDPPPYALSSAITRPQHPPDSPGSSPVSLPSLPTNNNLRHPRPLDISSLEPLKAIGGVPYAHAPPVLTGINIVHSPIRSYPSPPPSADSSSPSPPNEMLAYPPSPSSLKNRRGMLALLHDSFDSGQELLSVLTSIGATRPDGVRTQDERY